MYRVEWFKLFLDPSILLSALTQKPLPHGVPKSREEVKKWVVEYLSALYRGILNCLPQARNIRFLFTVPTTWRDDASIVDNFRDCITKSFDVTSGHSIEIGLNEPTAAAYYHIMLHSQSLKTGDILLICVVGGGTTNLSTIGVLSSYKLEELRTIEGISVGSCNVDKAFQQFIQHNLAKYQKVMKIETWDNILPKFNAIKHEFPAPASLNNPVSFDIKSVEVSVSQYVIAFPFKEG